MRKMKDSGIEWIGKIPEEWSIQRFKYVVNSLNKGNGITKDEVFPNGNVECVRYGEIYSKYNHSFQACFSRTNKEVVSSPQYFSYGDILFAGTGELIEEIGKNIVYLGSNACLAGGDIIVAKHSQDPSFLNYAMSSYYAQYQKSLGKAKLKVVHITATQIGNIRIILPSLPEQKKIADFLDAKCADIDQIRADIEKQIEILTNYKKSVITEAVTKGLDPKAKMKDSGIEWIGKIPEHWETRRIKSLGSARNGLTYSPNDVCDETQGTLVLRSSNIQNGKLCFDDNVYVTCDIPQELKVREGDILVCSRNGSRKLIGKNAIIGNIDATYGAFMMVFRSNYSRYMFYVLNSNVFSYYLGSFFTSTINQLTGFDFGNMKITFCPNERERNMIVSYLDEKCSEIDATISEKQKQLETLEEYKKSLIFEYVTGKKEVV